MNHKDVFDNGIIIFDGGVGTELYERGFFINRPFEELNLNSPADVQAVHESYIDAGAQVITTNTFSITKPQLKKFDIEDKQAELIEAAIKIANKARGNRTQIKIGLSIGPTGVLIEPLGPTSRDEAQGFFAEVAKNAKKVGGFDLYILETFSNVPELEDAIKGIRSVDKDTPLLASLAATSQQATLIEDFVERIATRDDVQAIGLNCAQGPSDLYTILKKIAPLVDKPIVVQPNAGVPNQINGRYFYMTSPDYLAKYAKNFVEAGAAGVGGCCGTGPAHIRAIRNAVQMLNAKRVHVMGDKKKDLQQKTRPPSRTLDQRKDSKIGAKLKAGEKIYSIEVLPPKGPNLDKFLNQLKMIEDKGVEFVNVPDGPRASTRISSLHIASYVNRDDKRKLKIIPHFTTRDRNLIALQSDLLGAAINSIHDILIVTGDPPKLGNNREATAIYDVDAIGLTYMIDCLNRGVSPNGENLGQATNFSIGVASNPTAPNLDLEIQRWQYKCESGADFTVTQPIFNPDAYLMWRDKIAKHSRPHVVGIWPLVSLRNAEFLANEVPGISVPASVLEEMAKAGDNSEDAIKRGTEIAFKSMERLNKECEGFCVSAPLGKVEVALELLTNFKNKK